ncbi:hypothetical protein QIS74_13693 [Colletotrichum tabaci]|uniref:Uncharacterized protein n=1 Tax=Colletotrichum tabaci TaxID=1209068 RepID=A0AAV9STK0_9PEZI
MSTDLTTFLNYMSGWTGASDEDIKSMIKEHDLFVALGDFNSDAAVDKEFTTLENMARDVRDTTIAADAVQIAADAAAVAAIWTFGLGMAAFAVLQTSALITRGQISNKSKALNEKMTTVDTDVATLINDPNISGYIAAYKANNSIVAAKAAKGMDGQTCRSILLQFMAQIEASGHKLDAQIFKQYANSARMLYNSKEINDVYDALDKLNMSGKSDEDVKKFMNTIKGFHIPGEAELAMQLARFGSLVIVAKKMGIARGRLADINELNELLGFEKETGVFKLMDAWGKFFAGIAIIVSVADAVLQILDIVDVVEQTKKMVDELESNIKPNYKSFFNGIKEAAKNYKQAIVKKSQ